jgi:hypothetical protein
MSTEANTESKGGALTEAELRALVAEAARKGGSALKAVAALLAVALVALMAVSAAGRAHEGARAVSCAEHAPITYGETGTYPRC